MIIKKQAIFLLQLLIIIYSCSNAHEKEVSHPEIRVMTLNMRYDNPEDSINNWKYRKENVADAVRFYDVDILGSQEMLNNQLEDLKKELPEYDYVGVGREDGKTRGEYSAVWYKTSRFKLQDSGNFWLSETPDVPGSKGWDAACERIATWVILKDTADNQNVFVLNTHLDHVGQTARRESVRLILEKLKLYSRNCPIIVTGDFNSEPESYVIEQITAPENDIRLFDTRIISPIVYGPSWSFHDFGEIPYDKRPLYDYIFVNNRCNVINYGVLAETDGELYLSDHCPVLVTLQVQN